MVNNTKEHATSLTKQAEYIGITFSGRPYETERGRSDAYCRGGDASRIFHVIYASSLFCKKARSLVKRHSLLLLPFYWWEPVEAVHDSAFFFEPVYISTQLIKNQRRFGHGTQTCWRKTVLDGKLNHEAKPKVGAFLERCKVQSTPCIFWKSGRFGGFRRCPSIF